MAKCTLGYKSQIQQGCAVNSWHVSQSVDAFTGTDDYLIKISGSLEVTGSAYLNPNKLLSTQQDHILTYNDTTGQIFKSTQQSVITANGVYRTGSDNNNIIPSKFGDNGANGTYAVVLGGSNNTASGASSFIGAGTLNTASADCTFIGGGCKNVIDNALRCGSVIVGGINNKTTSGYSPGPSFDSTFIGGGRNNCIEGFAYSFLGGGFCNTISGIYSNVLVGGEFNISSGNYNFIGGGKENSNSGYCSIVVGGYCNTNSGYTSTLIGGALNNLSCCYSFIGGGTSNSASADFATIVGGTLNTGSGAYSFIGGGESNVVKSKNSAILGACNSICANTISGYEEGPNFIFSISSSISDNYGYSTILGGCKNNISHCHFLDGKNAIINSFTSSIGPNNTGAGSHGTIIGSSCSTISGDYSNRNIIAGGFRNKIQCNYANSNAILGGRNNTISGYCSVILGGNNNSTSQYRGNQIIIGSVSTSIYGDNSTIIGGSNSTISSGYSSNNQIMIYSSNSTISTRYGSSHTLIGSNQSCISDSNSYYNTNLSNTAIINSFRSCICKTVRATNCQNRHHLILNSRDSLILNDSTTQTVTGSIIIGGVLNTASNANEGVIIGAENSRITGSFSCNNQVLGGVCNQIFSPGSRNSILGGFNNLIKDSISDYGFASNNTIIGSISSSIGGFQNTKIIMLGGCCNSLSSAYSSDSTAIGGFRNTFPNRSDSSIIIQGSNQSTSGYCTSIIGGSQNTISTNYAAFLSIHGGRQNSISSGYNARYNNITSGLCNTISGDYTSYIEINNGLRNNISMDNGYYNSIQNSFSSSICATISSYYSGFSNNTIINSSRSKICKTKSGGFPGYPRGRHTIIGSMCSLILDDTDTGSTGSIILGGTFNTSSDSSDSIMLGGLYNIITSSIHSTIVGGQNNIVDGSNYSSIVGGTLNTASGACSFIGGGCENTITNQGVVSFIGGGKCNTISNQYSTIAGGKFNNISSYCNNIIGGGECNTISGGYGDNSILGGSFNTVSSYKGTSIVGGFSNSTAYSACCSFLGGGDCNCITGTRSSIVGGTLNTASGNCGFIGGGLCNYVNSACAVIVGGQSNLSDVDSLASFMGAGCCNTITNDSLSAIIVGGDENIIDNSEYGVIVGGDRNQVIDYNHGTIVGGILNTASAACSGILGGENNYACETESFIIGSNLVTTASCTTFVNNLNISGSLADSDGDLGSAGQILSSTGTGLNWIDNSGGGGDSDWYDGTTYISSSVEIRVDETISGSSSIIVGSGITNNGSSIFSIGGSNNIQCANSSLNGFFNASSSCISGSANVVVGGFYNELHGDVSVIVGGSYNCIKPTNGQPGAAYSAMIGGLRNSIESPAKGTDDEIIYGQFIGGGLQNKIHTTLGDGGEYNSIIGGRANQISGSDLGCTFIGGGQANSISGSSSHSAIIGGINNCILDHTCTIIIGSNITATAGCTTYVNNLYITGSTTANAVMNLATRSTTPSPLTEGAIWNSGSAGAGCLYFSPDGTTVCRFQFV